MQTFVILTTMKMQTSRIFNIFKLLEVKHALNLVLHFQIC